MSIFEEIIYSLKKMFNSKKRRKIRSSAREKTKAKKKAVKKKTISKKKTVSKKKTALKKKPVIKKKVVKKKAVVVKVKKAKPKVTADKKSKPASRLKKKVSTPKSIKPKPVMKKAPSKKSPDKTKKVPAKATVKKKAVLVGEITHFFSKIQVVVLKITNVNLCVGDNILIKYKNEQFVQKAVSLQVESNDVKVAKKGQLVGLKVIKPVKVGALVFKV